MEVYKIWNQQGLFAFMLIDTGKVFLATEEPLETEQYGHLVLKEEKNKFMRTQIASKRKNGYFLTVLDEAKASELFVKFRKHNYVIEPTKNEIKNLLTELPNNISLPFQ